MLFCCKAKFATFIQRSKLLISFKLPYYNECNYVRTQSEETGMDSLTSWNGIGGNKVHCSLFL
jgi:hypothetical protein